MLQTTDEWQPNIKRDYFIMLPNNIWGRVKFYMIAQGDHFFQRDPESANPTPGSRKLEFDPTKVVKAP